MKNGIAKCLYVSDVLYLTICLLFVVVVLSWFDSFLAWLSNKQVQKLRIGPKKKWAIWKKNEIQLCRILAHAFQGLPKTVCSLKLLVQYEFECVIHCLKRYGRSFESSVISFEQCFKALKFVPNFSMKNLLQASPLTRKLKWDLVSGLPYSSEVNCFYCI